MSIFLLFACTMLDVQPRLSMMQPIDVTAYRLPTIEVLARPPSGPQVDYDDPNQGRRLLKAGRFADAYAILSRTARWGNKVDQYLLGMMYLKGQHVEQQPLLGYAWLKLSLEDSRTRAWRRQVRDLEHLMTDAERADASALLADLAADYGNDVLGVDCQRERRFNSRIRHDVCER